MSSWRCTYRSVPPANGILLFVIGCWLFGGAMARNRSVMPEKYAGKNPFSTDHFKGSATSFFARLFATIAAARSIDLYPVHRQMFPSMARIARSLVTVSRERQQPLNETTKPGVQNPHCVPF